MFKHSPKTIYIHTVLMWAVAIASFVGPLILIVPDGFHLDGNETASWSIHKVFGLIILCLVALQCILGMFTRSQQVTSLSSAKLIKVPRIIHQILGNLLLIISKVSVLIGWYGNYRNIFISIIVV